MTEDELADLTYGPPPSLPALRVRVRVSAVCESCLVCCRSTRHGSICLGLPQPVATVKPSRRRTWTGTARSTRTSSKWCSSHSLLAGLTAPADGILPRPLPTQMLRVMGCDITMDQVLPRPTSLLFPPAPALDMVSHGWSRCLLAGPTRDGRGTGGVRVRPYSTCQVLTRQLSRARLAGPGRRWRTRRTSPSANGSGMSATRPRHYHRPSPVIKRHGQVVKSDCSDSTAVRVGTTRTSPVQWTCRRCVSLPRGHLSAARFR